MSLLEVRDLRVSYGGIEALKGVSFDVEEGQIITLIGANGAGKSTTLKAISGLVKSNAGTILYKGEEIQNIDSQKVVEKGIALVPEGRRVFANLSVKENLLIGAYLRKNKVEIESDLANVYSLFPRLEERHWQSAGTLSGGEQQMLAVGRGLMAKPSVLMMDEPSLGLAPQLVRDILTIIERINDMGVTVLLIEQNANAALKIADKAYVLVTGEMVKSGPGQELLNDPQIRDAYLGVTNK